ncbi:MAG: hypothetical protein LBE98_04205 [Puniceicoccales bacterium]|jgi:hypothetical protein|nr:hypothetical protein [Puniceicoccales bacterium]
MNSLIPGVASLFLPKPLGEAAKFYYANKPYVDGCVSKGERLLKAIKTECPDQHALRRTVLSFKQPAKDQALCLFDMRSATTIPENDFIKNAREAFEAHTPKESTKRDLGFLAAEFNILLRKFETEALPKLTYSLPLSQAAISMITGGIDTVFQKIDKEIFDDKSKS